MPLDARIIRKRKRLYTREQLAALLGVSPTTIGRLERDPIPRLLASYLYAVGYKVAYYPNRKRDE